MFCSSWSPPSSVHCVGLKRHWHVSMQHSFLIGFRGLQVFMNEDRTRTFLALGATAGAQQVNTFPLSQSH